MPASGETARNLWSEIGLHNPIHNSVLMPVLKLERRGLTEAAGCHHRFMRQLYDFGGVDLDPGVLDSTWSAAQLVKFGH